MRSQGARVKTQGQLERPGISGGGEGNVRRQVFEVRGQRSDAGVRSQV